MSDEGPVLLLITGAGASTKLGRQEDIPMMAQWSSILSRALEQEEPGLSSVLGLEPDLASQEFEQALGSFLQWARILPLTSNLKGIGGTPLGSSTNEVVEWLNRSMQRIDTVIRVLHQTIYTEFGQAAVDREKTRRAYHRFLSHLGEDVRLICATTNYDQSIELGLELNNRSPRDGFATPYWGLTDTLKVHGLIDDSIGGGQTPVLHLHGSVGWYRNEEGHAIREPADRQFNPSVGQPVLLPPDPEKEPFNDAVVAEIWNEFASALAVATHILCIGHSLNDSALVRAIQSAITARTTSIRIAVTSKDVSVYSNEMFPGASVHIDRLAFGPSMESDSETSATLSRLNGWLRQ